jgi:hypothetical protein
MNRDINISDAVGQCPSKKYQQELNPKMYIVKTPAVLVEMFEVILKRIKRVIMLAIIPKILIAI